MLDTFPIVRREEGAAWGAYRTRALVLAYMAALEAGAPDAPVVGRARLAAAPPALLAGGSA